MAQNVIDYALRRQKAKQHIRILRELLRVSLTYENRQKMMEQLRREGVLTK